MLTVLILGACASNPPVQVPNWDNAQRPDTTVTDPIDLPKLCEIPRDGSWSPGCWLIFVDEYEVIAEGNTEIAAANAGALRKTEAAYDALVQAGKFQQELAVFREELLEAERRQRSWDKWYYRAVLGGLIIVGATL